MVEAVEGTWRRGDCPLCGTTGGLGGSRLLLAGLMPSSFAVEHPLSPAPVLQVRVQHHPAASAGLHPCSSGCPLHCPPIAWPHRDGEGGLSVGRSPSGINRTPGETWLKLGEQPGA